MFPDGCHIGKLHRSVPSLLSLSLSKPDWLAPVHSARTPQLEGPLLAVIELVRKQELSTFFFLLLQLHCILEAAQVAGTG